MYDRSFGTVHREVEAALASAVFFLRGSVYGESEFSHPLCWGTSSHKKSYTALACGCVGCVFFSDLTLAKLILHVAQVGRIRGSEAFLG